MEPSLTQEDLKTFLEAVDRFAERSIAPLVERHELALTPGQMEQLTGEAIRMGLLNLDPEPGLGLWENLEEAGGLSLSTAALRRVAQENTALAWHFHQLAFGRWLALRLGFERAVEQGPLMASIQGSYGLGRAALPHLLRGAELSEEEQALLADYFTPPPDGPALIVHQMSGWRSLLAPLFEEGRLRWGLYGSGDIDCQEMPRSHGLDELTTIGWRPQGKPAMRAELDDQQSRALYAEAMQVSALALMAVATGAVKRAYRIARDYAAVRVQGGTTINRLPAVQHMLAALESAIQLSEALTSELCLRPLAAERIAETLSVRSRVQPMLSQAASEAMQSMGGIGYMQDTGIEKALRDTNQLRLMHGTPGELGLFIAEWERLS